MSVTPLIMAIRAWSVGVVCALLGTPEEVPDGRDKPEDEQNEEKPGDPKEVVPIDKCDVNKPDASGYLPLTHASVLGDGYLVEMLIKAGARPDVLAGDRRSPLYYACCGGKPEIINMMLDVGPKVDGEELLVAVSQGLFLVSKALLEAGSKVDVGISTPLFEAVRQRRQDIAELLLAYGADPCAPCCGRETPLSMAISQNDMELIPILLQFCNEDLPQKYLNLACLEAKTEIMSMFLTYGFFDVNGHDESTSHTPLMMACSSGHVGAVRSLIGFGADVNQKCAIGFTALFHCIVNFTSEFEPQPPPHTQRDVGRFRRIAETLMRAGADLNAGIEPPLLVAIFFDMPEAAVWLLYHGADLRKVPRSVASSTVLEAAVRSGGLLLVRLFVLCGLDIHRIRLPCEFREGLEAAVCAGYPLCLSCGGRGADEECYVLKAKRNPLELKDLCRVAYRRQFSTFPKLEAAILGARIPKEMKDFLLFKYL